MDWQQYRLPIMGVLALAMVGVTWWAVTENTGDTAPEATNGGDENALPEVDADALTEIEIHRPGEDDGTIRLVKVDDAWQLAEPTEAPASSTAVTTVLDKLGDLEVVGRAASTSTHHEDMEVDAEHGLRVIARAGSDTVLDMYIGGFRAGNTLVRQEGQDAVLMVRGSIKFAFNKPPRDFRDRSITELTASEVSHATFTNENGSWSFAKRGNAWEQVIAAPAEGEEPAAPIEDYDGAKVGTMVSSLARLRSSDFAPGDATPDSLGLGDGAARVVLGITEGTDAEGEDAEGEDAEGEGAEGEGAEGEGAEGDGDADGDGDGDGEGDAPAPIADPTSTVTLIIGNEHEEGQRYVMVEGNDTIFIVSRFMADRLLPDAEDFTASAETPTPPTPPGGAPGGLPPGLGAPGGAPGGPGGGQIPPEIMRQIQQQLQQQGAGGGGPPPGGPPPGH